jgi:hypothetical protein
MRLFLPLLFGMLLALGCQNSSGPPLVPVRGTVTLNGKPLAGANVRFIPEGATQGVGSEAITDETGTYTLQYRRSGSGAIVGTYKVTVSKRRMPDGSAPEKDGSPITSPARETLPPIYSNTARSTLKAVVPEGGATLDFSLKTK